ncbi:hypothetical protein DH2020_005222 [Rehmannia glutinosa]|uniref:Uncharacterized protein n=1 Tax=Rehmannia glutinosa TaxID=99300 RepID=A0ABR0W7A6_REHGL
MVQDMALQKRLDYGFNGYQVPPTPRAARSARKRCLFKRKADDQQICAFDLLATVAGKLLSDEESSPPSANTSSGKEQSRLRPASGLTTSDCSEKVVGPAEQLVNDDCKLRLGIFSPVDFESSGFKLSAKCGLEDGIRKDIKVEPANIRNLSIITRDNDEKSSECTEPFARNKAIKPPPRIGDRRFRKFLPSKHCKITSNVKDEERYNAENFNYLNRKNNFKRQRSLRDYPFKRESSMTLAQCLILMKALAVTEYVGPENGTNGGGLGSGPTQPGVIATPTSVQGGYMSFHTRDDQVKLKIKSFRVPELLIEVSENSTIGSLKQTVMDAVNSVLGGGLCVGVLVQGKKIRDDNKTLLQTGILHDNKMDTLGFTLEPSSTPAPIRHYPEDRPAQLLCDSPQPLARYPPTPRVTQSAGQLRNLDTSPDLPGTSFNNFMESDHDSDPSSPGMSSQRTTSESKALVPTFTVAEVEALVQAVEKLGTGRWRDVKLRAFDSAKHRTYVDLKDKWKTLVHTARISPQQRRGEPVPQELLDRVLTAHAYWSQQQAKQQLKSQPDTCLLL